MHGIGLSTIVFDLNGARYFRGQELHPEEAGRNLARERRGARVPTLDGGCVAYDTGYSATDRNIAVRVRHPSEDVRAYLIYMVESYTIIMVTTEDGAYLATPKRFSIDDDGSATLIAEITGG